MIQSALYEWEPWGGKLFPESRAPVKYPRSGLHSCLGSKATPISLGMALFGQIPLVKKQVTLSSGFVTAFDYVTEVLTSGSSARRRLDAMAAGDSGKIDLGSGVFAIEQVYYSKPRSEGFFESHKIYIDVQVVVEGVEAMEVADVSHLQITDPYVPEKDVIKYADTPMASVLRVGEGAAAVFFPTDGHMPTLQLDGQSKLVRKTVVKVPVA
jgi:biofilm protein TabA